MRFVEGEQEDEGLEAMIELLPTRSTSSTHPDDGAEYIFGVMAVTVNSLSQDNWDLLLDSVCHTHVTTFNDDRGKKFQENRRPYESPRVRRSRRTAIFRLT